MCDEKAQLLAAYAAAVSALSKAVNNGIEEGFAIARTERDYLYKKTEELRLKAEKTRNALHQHIAHHHCLSKPAHRRGCWTVEFDSQKKLPRGPFVCLRLP
jgi:hypothetical protein